MADYMLLRIAMIGFTTGMFALTIFVEKMAYATWHGFYQRKEHRG